jgi:tripartite-type tricarboxylate transporter receptor subunit TctC
VLSSAQRLRIVPAGGSTDVVARIMAERMRALPQVRTGTIKAIANLSPRRSQAVPDIPTSDEGGVPGLYMSGWFGFFAPKGTPKDVIARLNDAMVQTLAEPAVREWRIEEEATFRYSLPLCATVCVAPPVRPYDWRFSPE